MSYCGIGLFIIALIYLIKKNKQLTSKKRKNKKTINMWDFHMSVRRILRTCLETTGQHSPKKHQITCTGEVSNMN